MAIQTRTAVLRGLQMGGQHRSHREEEALGRDPLRYGHKRNGGLAGDYGKNPGGQTGDATARNDVRSKESLWNPRET